MCDPIKGLFKTKADVLCLHFACTYIVLLLANYIIITFICLPVLIAQLPKNFEIRNLSDCQRVESNRISTIFAKKVVLR